MRRPDHIRVVKLRRGPGFVLDTSHRLEERDQSTRGSIANDRLSRRQDHRLREDDHNFANRPTDNMRLVLHSFV